MQWLLFALILIGTFVLMEGVTWLTHKYVMHGFLWNLHEDHHRPRPGIFEKNDAFFVAEEHDFVLARDGPSAQGGKTDCAGPAAEAGAGAADIRIKFSGATPRRCLTEEPRSP